MRGIRGCLAIGLLAACGGGQHNTNAAGVEPPGGGGTSGSASGTGNLPGGGNASAGNASAGTGNNPSGGTGSNPSGGSPAKPSPSVAISPAVFTIFVGKSVQLSATIAEIANQDVTWAVAEADCGAVSDAGEYTAPKAVPSSGQCHVRATSVQDTKLIGEARMLVTDQVSGGTPGEWVNLAIPVGSYGDDAGGAQTVVVDPVRPSDFYAFVSVSDSVRTAVLKSTDFGLNWKDVNTTDDLHGTPWGAAIDPNPKRDASKPPTLYCPAGFGSNGLWKSTDGGITWTNVLEGPTAFDAYNPYGKVDAYGAVVLPDDPPNHVLVTYHYGFKGGDAPQANDGGFGETKNGGKTWEVHVPPAGIGNSHYIVPLDALTWLSIAQYNEGKNGIWKTTSGGRIDGKIDPAAWKKVDDHEHPHGSFQPYVDPKSGAVYLPGFHGIKRSTDKGDSWAFVQDNTGYTSSVIGTDKYLYSNFRDGPSLLRADRSDGTKWAAYATAPDGMRGAPPYGNGASFDGQHWILVMGGHKSGLWRYVEP